MVDENPLTPLVMDWKSGKDEPCLCCNGTPPCCCCGCARSIVGINGGSPCFIVSQRHGSEFELVGVTGEFAPARPDMADPMDGSFCSGLLSCDVHGDKAPPAPLGVVSGVDGVLPPSRGSSGSVLSSPCGGEDKLSTSVSENRLEPSRRPASGSSSGSAML